MTITKNKSVAFVILHYNVTEETLNCVESIKRNIDTNDYSIIIIDNCSPNKSGDIIKKIFAQDPIVTVLIMDNNLGFARGNNVGIEYAKQKLNADFVCCLNNDTLLEQSDFMEKLLFIYNKNKAAVIGPLVYLKDGSIQQHHYKMYSISEYQKQLSNWEKVLSPNWTYGIKQIISNISIVNKVKNNLIAKNRKYLNEENEYYLHEHEDILLHGCCLIFTPLFFDNLNGFCQDTFLYNEEEILYLDLKLCGLHNVYSPAIQIRHMENAATDSIVRNNKERMQFLARNKTQSLKILIGKMKHAETITGE